ncbi:peroxidasin-like [Watersipora subatra]|uniref:peroxidasin-like n=1 Tax=Watersipora subatra TaxID=2589382 RepID=UPI00355C87C2
MELTEYLLFISIAWTSSVRAACPDSCTCFNQRIDCSVNAVDEIPNTGNRNVTILDLNGNRLADSTLSRNDFAHLLNLQELILSDCGIQTVQPNTFADLTQLNLIDLSLNILQNVDREAFAGLTLNYLFLGDNPGIALPDAGFTDLSTEVLDLQNCRLEEITISFLSPLSPELRKLFINGNRIQRFQPELIDIFSQLESIRIQENPLICDCKARFLKNFYDGNMDKFRQTSDGSKTEPRCSEPPAVAVAFFNTLSAADFPCDKPSMDSIVSFMNDKSVLRCISKGQPPPKLAWFGPDGSLGETTPGQNDVTEAEIEIAREEGSGLYRCVASNEAGNTSFSVNLSWPPLIINDVQEPCKEVVATTGKEVIIDSNNFDEDDVVSEEPDVFKRKYFTIVHIIVAVFGTFVPTLIITIVVLHVCVYKKRKNSSSYSTSPNSDYSSGGSVKNETFPQANVHQLQIHSLQHMPTIQSRPLPSEPCHKAYDENHYMSTQLADNEDLVCFGQHNGGTLITSHPQPTCQCQPMRSQSRHSQIL